MYKLSENPLLPAEKIHERIKQMAEEINASGEFDVVLGVLTGAYIFVADLSRELLGTPRIAFVKASSYGNSTESSGSVSFQGLEFLQLENARVLLIDDILDTGRTISKLKKELENRGAKEVKLCVLLDKPSRRIAEIEADFAGFSIENLFVVGYGLDYAEQYRSLKDVFTLEPLT